MLQWRGGCVQCGAPRSREDIATGRTQIYMVRDDGNKTIIGLCDKCFKAGEFDYEAIQKNLADSEMDCATASRKHHLIKHAEGFKALKFVGHEKRG